ncbi:MAG: glycerate kinase [Nocardioidaceae bacterium]|nr:glycerate kinase [Nocardioidaceae bacterium]
MPPARSRRVVIAPDSFKGSISAAEAARAIATGWLPVRPHDDLSHLPMADGGEGTLDALALPNTSTWHILGVTGPDGRPVEAAWLLLGDGTAVVEVAQTSGLPLMATPDALGATSRGLGDLLAAVAREPEVRRIVVGLGGSASTDGGRGALEALGTVPPPRGGVVCLTDVTAPLLGPRGAARQFGPQKGASPADVEVLEDRLRAWAALLGGDPDQPGAGAAGGIAFGLATRWGAVLRPGAPYVASAIGLDAAVADADLVVTGEGSFDGQSLQGKATGHVLEIAARYDRPALVACGRAGLRAHEGVLAVVETSRLAGSAAASMAEAARWLTEAGGRMAALATDPPRSPDV